jgi:uncharacterized protein YggE
MSRVGVILVVVTLLLVAAVLAVELGLVMPKAQAGGAPEVSKGTISATGEGKVTADPDLAQVVIGVDTRALTAKEAAEKNTETMNEVFAAIRGMGIEDKDIQTANYSVQAEINYDAQGEQRLVGYLVSNQVVVKMRDLEKVGDLLDAVTQAGANNIYGITFTVEDFTPLKSEARAKAVADAMSRAQQLADAANVRLGDLSSLSETEMGGNMFLAYTPQAVKLGGDGAAPIAPGQLEVTVQVVMTYAISK